MFDVVVRGGTVVDGTGTEPVEADVGIDGDRIVAIEASLGPGRREIDADGRLVTPGFVDVHTHYDGQATWDPELEPSTPHGVTTVVFGNCGVGFAPVAPGKEQFLVELMEGVEDIPGTALTEGMPWNWETFEDYLDVLENRSYAADVSAMIAHGAVRAYVMGDRGAANEPADGDDIARMGEVVEAAIRAGARGVSTSRTLGHRAMNGEPVPGTYAAEAELYGLARAVGRAGRGLLEVAPAGIVADDHLPPDTEVEWMTRLSKETGTPVTFLLLQTDHGPLDYREQLARISEARGDGVDITPQVAGRPFGVLLGLAARHRFSECPSFAPLASRTPAEKASAMRDPALREKLKEESRAIVEFLRVEVPTAAQLFEGHARTYPLGDPVDYEPSYEQSIAGMAEATGRDPVDVYYDALLEREGEALLMMTLLGYSDGNGDALHEMLSHPDTVIGLADGGAHCNLICDASTPTWMLTHWARDRNGDRIAVPEVVRKLTSEPAALFGFGDRGRLATGLRADVNVIDHDRLTLREPRMVADLPAGGTRFVQAAEGYAATIVAGRVTREADEFTGVHPGRLVRSR